MKWYSLAAAAAGVTTLALSQPADAKVVITNTNIPVPFCVIPFPCSVSIDLNGDGINDVKFSLLSSVNQTWNSRLLTVVGQNGGSITGTAGTTSTVRMPLVCFAGQRLGLRITF